MGEKFFTDNPVVKEFDSEVFRKSCRRAVAKGIKVCRLGKHSDSGDSSILGITSQVLKIAAEEQIQCVFVSKSLEFNKEIAESIKSGNHILHMSLGMITQARTDKERMDTYLTYKRYRCNAYLRIVEDITKPVPDYLKIDCGLGKKLRVFQESCLITPMRFNGKLDAVTYRADLSKFKWLDGYYRPIKQAIHEEWFPFKQYCGETWNSETEHTETYCANCLIGE
jgi:hypothetical protein